MLQVWRPEALLLLFSLYMDVNKIRNSWKRMITSWNKGRKWDRKCSEFSVLVNFGYAYFTRSRFIFFILKNIYVCSTNIRFLLVPRLEFLPCKHFWLGKIHVVHSLRQMRKSRVLQHVTFLYFDSVKYFN